MVATCTSCAAVACQWLFTVGYAYLVPDSHTAFLLGNGLQHSNLRAPLAERRLVSGDENKSWRRT